VQQALVGPWQHSQNLIALALHRGLLPHLGVLQREDHHQRHGRGEGLKRGQPQGGPVQEQRREQERGADPRSGSGRAAAR